MNPLKKLFRHKEEPKESTETEVMVDGLWKTPIKVIDAKIKMVETPEQQEVFTSKLRKLANKIHLPRIKLPSIKLKPRVVKAKRILVGILAVLYAIAGASMYPNPLIVFPLLTSYFLFDYIWVTRKLSWFAKAFENKKQ
jgi:hypothetical protein